jgi:hypothetical protein
MDAIAPGSVPTSMTARVMRGDPDAIDKATEHRLAQPARAQRPSE